MPLEKNKLLIVDDEPDTLEFLHYNFKKNGFRVLCEKDGLSGFLAMESVKPDIVIIDIMMPLMNGIMLGDQLKKDIRYNRIPILFLSVAVTKYVEDAATKINEHYLCKPVPFNILLEKVKKIITSKYLPAANNKIEI